MKQKLSTRILLVVILALFCILFLMPIYFIAVNSLKTYGEILTNFASLPSHPSFDSYLKAWDRMNYLQTFFNTMFLSAGSAVVTILLGSMAGYKLQRTSGKFAKGVQMALIYGLIIPFPVIMVPMTQMMTQIFDLSNNLVMLIFVYAAMYMPTATFIFNGFCKSIPRQLDEVAMLDGCGPFRSYFQIIFPLLAPAISTVAVFAVVWTWNDFLTVMLLVDDPMKMTLTRAQAAYLNVKSGSEWDFFTASIMMSTLPILILYVFLQKHVQAGLTSGAIKG